MGWLESHAASLLFLASLNHTQVLVACHWLFLVTVQAELLHSLPDLASVSRRFFRGAHALVRKARLAMASEVA